ncbi:acyl-CoA synthetase [Variovorax ginsengisoli]|uniref:Long-chain fatty acid--CoA ligase n=1 Tax=Variovorax ginsengisoli TaxID=363844 RepID=A0ABT8SAF4_9BURK|nr:long-chain fatty acid--CoA ligase [Variovorax ginsengisoli]MDN8616585.1 long-chain fatty acid--CoA ligase [Variovorax ginsengisoli]MDO1535755.1 long-chain fatty acid--CoA ligase [Variovorax ginsengisoli]
MDGTLTGAPTDRSAHAVGLHEWLSRRAGRVPGRPALSCGEVRWSYGELQRRIQAMSAVLAAGGVAAGDRVGYLGLNDPMFVVVMFATSRLGGVFVPLNFRLSGPELAWIIGDAGIHTLVAGEEHVPVIDGVRATLACKRFIHRAAGAPGWEPADALMAQPGAVPAAVPATADALAVIMYTSGTTGHPKGAMLTHGNFWANNLNEMLLWDMVSTDVTLNFAPMFHVGGLLCGSLSTLLAGGHLVLQRAFDVAAMLQAVREHRITVSFAVPAMLLFISQHPDFAEADLSSLRLIAVGGAPMPEPLLRLYAARGIPVHQGYGMTETASMITFLSPDRATDKLGSSGTPPLLTEIRLIDAVGDAITEPGVAGEVCVRGANVMAGYWRQPEATAAVFTRDGWFRSGDVGYRDAEGFLYICDRLKDMVISGGENIYPAEVESVLYDHPDIAEVAVVGAPDERWGERVVAVVAVKPGRTITLEALQAFAETRLARYKLPRELRIVDALPRNPTGKVLKAKLRVPKEGT